MHKLLAIALIAVGVLAGTAHAESSIDQKTLSQAQGKTALINKIMGNFRTQLAQRPDPSGYSQRLSSVLLELNETQLKTLSTYVTLPEFETALGGIRANSGGQAVTLKAVSADDSGYVFKPVTPCGLVDTRFRTNAKPMIANTAEVFNVWNGVTQGSTSPCSASAIPTGEIGALALTATAVGASSDGWLIMSPAGEASESSVLNYMPRDAIANSTVLKYTNGFSLKASTNTHVLVNLIGVYVKSEDPKFSCYDAPFVDVMVPPGERMEVTLPACKAGYQAVSANCTTAGLSLTRHETAYVDPTFGGTGLCAGTNNGNYTAQLGGTQKCCKVTK